MDFRRLPVLAGPVVAGVFLLGGCAAGPATSAAAPAEWTSSKDTSLRAWICWAMASTRGFQVVTPSARAVRRLCTAGAGSFASINMPA